MLYTKTYSIATKGDGTVVDLTRQLSEFLASASFDNGLCTISATGSTYAISTMEYEPGLIEDMNELLQRVAPKGPVYHHDARWGDGNGYAHVRATLLGPSISFPVVDGEAQLGTWQQPILLDFDNRSRTREVAFTLVG